MNEKNERHLDVYDNRYELHQDDNTYVYFQGPQSEKTKERSSHIKNVLDAGYLDNIMESLPSRNYDNLSSENQQLLKNLVNGLTSEVGRAIVGLTCLQLTIKAIAPDQSIRLHKGNNTGKFSWMDGIAMRSLDAKYNVPFLRKYGLLNLNKYGSFMTRSLAENYPYSGLYKADMQGPVKEWLSIVDAVEAESMPSELGLCYLISLLKNRSDNFCEMAGEACNLTKNFCGKPFDKIKGLIVSFFNETDYSARAFEVVMHGFYQALYEMDLLGDFSLVPLSQMRSANKKHSNVGDVELTEDVDIVEAWDAKYGKPYLRDELEELQDKLLTHPEVKVAGFVCDKEVDLRRDIIDRKIEIEEETGTEIYLLSFEKWIQFILQEFNVESDQINLLGYNWLVAVVESFSQKKIELAPIDEPCDAWVKDLIDLMKEKNISKN